jgi:hypothetical protein
VLLTNRIEVPSQVVLERRREHRDSILVALGAPNHDLVPAEVDVLHAQATALEQAEPRAVEQRCHQPWDTTRRLEYGSNLVACQHDRQTLGALGADDTVEPWDVEFENLAIQEQQSAQGLVLRRCGDPSLDRE